MYNKKTSADSAEAFKKLYLWVLVLPLDKRIRLFHSPSPFLKRGLGGEDWFFPGLMELVSFQWILDRINVYGTSTNF